MLWTLRSAALTGILVALLPSPGVCQQSPSGRSVAGGGSGQRVTIANRDARAPQGFSVVLVLGEMQGTGAQDTVPPAARKALADMKDFLPYKGYRLLDVQWTLCCSGRGSSGPVLSRLRGAYDKDYELTLSTFLEGQPRLSVRFLLRELAAEDGTAGEAGGDELTRELVREVERVRLQLATVRAAAQKRYEVGTGGPVDENRDVVQLRERLADMEIKLAQAKQRRGSLNSNHPELRAARAGAMTRALIDTSFTMDVGETVVVGTSRLAGGDKALIALLTAVPRNAQPK
jgi:hypothetical protein